jgi:hypothetical protein
LGGNVIKLSIRPLILEETLLKKGFFQAIFLKLLKVLGKGLRGKTLFQKGFPLKLMTLPLGGEGGVRGLSGRVFIALCTKSTGRGNYAAS